MARRKAEPDVRDPLQIRLEGDVAVVLSRGIASDTLYDREALLLVARSLSSKRTDKARVEEVLRHAIAAYGDAERRRDIALWWFGLVRETRGLTSRQRLKLTAKRFKLNEESLRTNDAQAMYRFVGRQLFRLYTEPEIPLTPRMAASGGSLRVYPGGFLSASAGLYYACSLSLFAEYAGFQDVSHRMHASDVCSVHTLDAYVRFLAAFLRVEHEGGELVRWTYHNFANHPEGKRIRANVREILRKGPSLTGTGIAVLAWGSPAFGLSLYYNHRNPILQRWLAWYYQERASPTRFLRPTIAEDRLWSVLKLSQAITADTAEDERELDAAISLARQRAHTTLAFHYDDAYDDTTRLTGLTLRQDADRFFDSVDRSLGHDLAEPDEPSSDVLNQEGYPIPPAPA